MAVWYNVLMDTKSARAVKTFRALTKVEYALTILVAILFLLMGSPWILHSDRYVGQGAGAAMVFSYIIPIVVLNGITLLCFLVFSLLAIRRSPNKATILKYYKKYALACTIKLVVSVAAIVSVLPR